MTHPTSLDFLKTILAPLEAKDDYYELRCIPHKGPANRPLFFKDAASLAEMAEAHANHHHVFVGLGTRRGQHGDAAHTKAVRTLYVDADPQPDYDPDAAIKAAPLQFTGINDSGHGRHPFVVLKEPIRDAAVFEEYAIRLALATSSNGKSPTPMKDFPRCVRMPYTTNKKEGKPSVKSSILELHPDRLYTLEELDRLLPPLPKGGIANAERRLGKGRLYERLLNSDEVIPVGDRRPVVISLLGLRHSQGRGEDASRAELEEFNRTRFAEELTDAQIDDLMKSAGKWPEPKEEPLHRTDEGNAQRIIRAHGANLRYCRPWRKWLVWDGKRWLEDDLGLVETLAKDVPRMIVVEAQSITDPDEWQATIKWALRSEDVKQQNALVSLARTEPGIPIGPESLDTNDWLFNLENGTLDLRNGEFRPHRREDYLTKMAPVIFDPEAKCPRFLEFLEWAMQGDAKRIDYLERTLGRALTGDVENQHADFLLGTGDNGKTTLMETMNGIWGDYGATIASAVLMMRGIDKHTCEVAQLKGVRLAVSSEVSERSRLNEERIKALTGTGRMNARRLFQAPMNWKPTHHIFLEVNHKPVIEGTEHAIWKRIHIIPFNVRIPKAEMDLHLKAKLWEERSGILNWLLEGCRRWQEGGLDMSDVMEEAVAEYRGDMDIVAAWIGDRCVEDKNAITLANTLFHSYKRWAEASNERMMVSVTSFGTRLRERGYIRRQKEGRRAWQGIRLREAGGVEGAQV